MKKSILWILLLLNSATSQYCHVAGEPDEAPQVMVCRSGTSYAYHKKMCRGLQKCTHKIDKVSIEQAQASGHGKPCGYCYGRSSQ